MPSAVRAVIFDWDGTLVDSAEATYRTYVRTFAQFGIPFDRAEYERSYSPDWYHTFSCVGLPEEKWHEADARWLACFAEETPKLHAETRIVLDSLNARGIARAIVTAGSRDRVRRELASHGIEAHFAQVVFGDDTASRKPHPEPINLCLDRLGIEPGQAAYVGDSPEDIMMARAAGVFSVAVPGGYPNRTALEAAAPDLFAESLGGAIFRLLEDHA